MLTLFTLFMMMALGGIAIVSLIAIAAALKFTMHLVLVPFKLLLLPFVLVAVVIKFAVLISLVAVAVALILPLAIILGLIVAPFALASAVLS